MMQTQVFSTKYYHIIRRTYLVNVKKKLTYRILILSRTKNTFFKKTYLRCIFSDSEFAAGL